MRAVFVTERAQQDVNMVGHYDHTVQTEEFTVACQEGLQSDFAGCLWKYPAVACAECDEKHFIVRLVMRQLAAVFVFAEHGDRAYHK